MKSGWRASVRPDGGTTPRPPRKIPAEGSASCGGRVGNGCGFWGDSPDAPVRLAEAGRLDYLTLEYLAELTMSILAVQRQKDAAAGFATDFPHVLGRSTIALADQPQLKIVTNAGGMNSTAAQRKRATCSSPGQPREPPRRRRQRRRPDAAAG